MVSLWCREACRLLARTDRRIAIAQQVEHGRVRLSATGRHQILLNSITMGVPCRKQPSALAPRLPMWLFDFPCLTIVVYTLLGEDQCETCGSRYTQARTWSFGKHSIGDTHLQDVRYVANHEASEQ